MDGLRERARWAHEWAHATDAVERVASALQGDELARWSARLASTGRGSIAARLAAWRRAGPRDAMELTDWWHVFTPVAEALRAPAGEGDGLRCFLDEGRRKLGVTPELVPAARKALEAELLAQLSQLAEPTLMAEVPGGGTPASGDATGAAWLGRFDTYPCLARILAQEVVTWAYAARSMLQRLAADRSRIATELLGADPGQVIDIRPALGDRHGLEGGTCALQFEGGTWLIYKPVALGVEGLLGALLGQRESALGREPRLLQGEGYHWRTLVPYREPEPHQLGVYARHLGTLAGALLLCAGADVHRDNVIPHGGIPVVVDTEALLTPSLAGAQRAARDGGIERAWRDSVLASALLPDLHAPFARADPRTAGVAASAHFWTALAGEGGGRLVDEVVRGFEAFAETVRRESLRVSTLVEGVVAGGALARCMVRDTVGYQALLRASLEPHLLRNGCTRSAFLEASLLRCPLEGTLDDLDAVVFAEVSALLEGFIPAFATRLGAGPGPATRYAVLPPSVVAQSGPERFREARVRFQDAAWVARQSALVRRSLHRESAATPHAGTSRDLAWHVRSVAEPLGEVLAALAPAQAEPDLLEGPLGAAFFLAQYGRVLDDPRALEQAWALTGPTLTALARGDAVVRPGLAGAGGWLVHLRVAGNAGVGRESAALAAALARPAAGTPLGLRNGLAGSLLGLVHAHEAGWAPRRAVAALTERVLAEAAMQPIGSGWLQGRSGVAQALSRARAHLDGMLATETARTAAALAQGEEEAETLESALSERDGVLDGTARRVARLRRAATQATDSRGWARTLALAMCERASRGGFRTGERPLDLSLVTGLPGIGLELLGAAGHRVWGLWDL